MLLLLISSSRGESRALITKVPGPDFITQGVSPRRDAVYFDYEKGSGLTNGSPPGDQSPHTSLDIPFSPVSSAGSYHAVLANYHSIERKADPCLGGYPLELFCRGCGS
jgi:hypothetical protein